MSDATDDQPIDLLMTEDALFAEMGRLYFKNYLLDRQVVTLRMKLASATVINSPEGDADADSEPGEPRDGSPGVSEVHDRDPG